VTKFPQGLVVVLTPIRATSPSAPDLCVQGTAEHHAGSCRSSMTTAALARGSRCSAGRSRRLHQVGWYPDGGSFLEIQHVHRCGIRRAVCQDS
jgi:hypothetical protein